MNKSDRQQNGLPWHAVEAAIHRETTWLNTVIQTYTSAEDARDTAGHPVCKDCLLRDIALLIVRGDVKVREITKGAELKEFWHHNKNNAPGKRIKIRHGKEWHSGTMSTIEAHFLSQGFEVEREPNLQWGRADLGVYKDDVPPLLIEVGTTSFFKISRNLQSMQNFMYLIVPDDERLIEFRKQ